VAGATPIVRYARGSQSKLRRRKSIQLQRR
jgi:hypothetical protein